MLDDLAQDVRYALRRVQRSPGFAFTVIVTLALAIGANTALFSVLNAIVLRPLPVNEPSRLVALTASDERGQQPRPIYHSTFIELARHPIFEALSLYSGGGLFLTQARDVLGEGGIEAVTPQFHEALGLRPLLGRFFTAADAPAEGSAAPVAVISHRFWQQYYSADPRAINETLYVSGTPLTVIGVAPPEYKGLHVDGGFDFSIPLAVLIRQLGTDPKLPVRGLNAVGRLRAGVTLEQARAAVESAWSALRLSTIPPGLSPTEQEAMRSQRIRVESLSRGFSNLRARYEDPLVLLIAITSVLLAVGCLNFSGLLLARAAARHQQLAVQLALGATRRRLVQQFLVEGMLLSALGAAAALPLAWWVVRVLASVMWEGSGPLSISLTPDLRVLAVAAAVAVAAGLTIGVLPALAATRSRRTMTLRPAPTVTRSTGRMGKAVLVAQVALSLVLLVAAGLLATSLSNLRSIDSGFRTDGLRWSRLFAVPGGYRNQNDAVYYPELVRRLSAVSGIQSVALSHYFPAYFNFRGLTTVAIARSGATNDSEQAQGMMEFISPRFFETVGIPLLRGRDFSWSDDSEHPEVAIINQTLNRRLFPQGDALGARIRIGTDPKRRGVQIVGIVSDATVGNLRTPHLPVAFRPKMQEPQFARAPVVTLRTDSDPVVVDAAVTKTVSTFGHEYVRRLHSLEDQVDRSLIQERLMAAMSSFFAGLALLLAFVGLYGLLAHGVAMRTREIGVRVALGAPRIALIRMVVRDGLILTLLGTALGLTVALAAAPLIGTVLFGVAPADPATLVLAAASFVVVGAVAGLRPAHRASTVDPITALRAE